MLYEAEAATLDGKLPARATNQLPREHRLSLRRLAMRLAFVLAFGFNISGLGDLYVAGKALRNYLRDTKTLSSPTAASDIVVYVCSGILLATGFYALMQQMTSTANDT
jgi:hypothetical protein